MRIRTLKQLFNTLDATPFPGTDLGDDADEFIFSWAQDLPRRAPLVVRISVSESTPGDALPQETIDAIRNYYAYRAGVFARQLRELLGRGYLSLVIGLACLTTSIVGAQLIQSSTSGTLFDIIREGVIIGGWVAMWRPIQILLYDWWPVRQRRRLCERLAGAAIEVHCGPDAHRELPESPVVGAAAGAGAAAGRAAAGGAAAGGAAAGGAAAER